MTNRDLAAQIHARRDPDAAAALHAISRLRGRSDALEAAIARGDAAARVGAILSLLEIVGELASLDGKAAA